MKNILKALGGMIAFLYHKVTGQNDDALAPLPENVAITPEQVDQVIAIVNRIKMVVDNPAVIILTDLIPSNIDNIIRSKVSDAIAPVMAGLTFIRGWLPSAAGRNQLLNEAIGSLHISDDPDKDAFYHALAARLIMVVSDGKVTWSEAVSFIEVYFKNVFKPAATLAAA